MNNQIGMSISERETPEPLPKDDGKHRHYIPIIIWYIVFLLIIPYSIKSLFSFEALRYYFPVVDLIANIFTSSGQYDKVFEDLYNLSPDNFISYISYNLISLIALLGVSWNGIAEGLATNNLWRGIEVALVMYIVTYLLPTQTIPYIVRKTQEYLDSLSGIDYEHEHIHWWGYFVGALLSIVLVTIEFYIIRWYIKGMS